VCVCVKERKKERKKERETQREREKKRKSEEWGWACRARWQGPGVEGYPRRRGQVRLTDLGAVSTRTESGLYQDEVGYHTKRKSNLKLKFLATKFTTRIL